MRSIAIVVNALILAFWCISAHAEGLPVLTDPVFGLSLKGDFYSKRFEEVQSSILEQCKVKVRADTQYRYWVFASAPGEAGIYMLIAGTVKRDSKWIDDSKGSFLLRRSADCVALDPADEVFPNYSSYVSGKSVRIEKRMFQELAIDAARRFTDAYGGREAFLASLRRARHDAVGFYADVLQEALY